MKILFFGLVCLRAEYCQYICITCTVHQTVISVKHFAIASAGFFFCWLVSPFRERNNFIRLSLKHKIVLYLQMFQHTKLYLSFSKSQPRLYS